MGSMGIFDLCTSLDLIPAQYFVTGYRQGQIQRGRTQRLPRCVQVWKGVATTVVRLHLPFRLDHTLGTYVDFKKSPKQVRISPFPSCSKSQPLPFLSSPPSTAASPAVPGQGNLPLQQNCSGARFSWDSSSSRNGQWAEMGSFPEGPDRVGEPPAHHRCPSWAQSPRSPAGRGRSCSKASPTLGRAGKAAVLAGWVKGEVKQLWALWAQRLLQHGLPIPVGWGRGSNCELSSPTPRSAPGYMVIQVMGLANHYKITSVWVCNLKNH